MGFNLKRAEKWMQEKGIDCIVATSYENVYYSTDSNIVTIRMLKRLAPAFYPLDGDPVLGFQHHEEEAVRRSTWIKDLRVYEGGEWEPMKAINFIADVLKEKGLKKAMIGMELMDIPGPCFDYLRELLPSAIFVDAQPMFDKMRSVKSSEELKLLSYANMATAKAIVAGFEMAKPGDTEKEISRNLRMLLLEYGADSVGGQFLSAGENTLDLHHIVSDYEIKKGDMVHTDFGGKFKGYGSDIARMAVVGEPNEKQLRAHRAIVKAEKDTAEAMWEGATVASVVDAVQKSYESSGYIFPMPFIGHGIGIGGHEIPFLGPSHSDWILEEGMFFQLEPYLTVGNFRVHTEDSFIVTKGTGAKIVSEYRDISELQIIK